jgi:LDH2 family malate/lactate/ureidoglycolate dehydrogenase
MQTKPETGYITFEIDQLKDFSTEMLTRCGMREEDARVVADVLVTTDQWGIATHGTAQLGNYTSKILAGGIIAQAVPERLTDGPGWATIDGKGGMPHVTSVQAMELAIEKASNVGIAYVGVKGSTHFGAAGYYANMAVKRDMIGIAMSNVEVNMTIPGAKSGVMGNNPFAYAVPAGEEHPVFLDVAFSVVAAAKVYSAGRENGLVPDNWLVDEHGLPTNDACKYPGTAMLLPTGGHKGYGLAVMVEVLAGALTGSLMTRDIRKWMDRLGETTDEGHAFIVIDIGKMMPIDEFKARMDHMIRGIKSTPRSELCERLYLPGEMEWERYDKSLVGGIPLSVEHVARLDDLAAKFGIERMGETMQDEK